MGIAVPRTPFPDISKATKLKYLMFLWQGSDVQWIITTLQTLESKTVQDISIYPLDPLPETVEEAICEEWRNLDRPLVQFGTSHSTRIRVAYVTGNDTRGSLPNLLPELTRRGLVDLVEAPYWDSSKATTTVWRVMYESK